MNFEKLFLKNKNNILLFFIVILVIFFITRQNKVKFLYGSPLGRAYLIALLILLTKYNRYLGLISVIIISMIYNSTDTITENFTEGEETKEKPTILGAISEKLKSIQQKKKDGEETKKEETNTEEAKKEGYENSATTQASMADNEDSMRPKSSKSLPLMKNFSSKNKEPTANWSGKEGLQGLGFSAL
jgi:hypothetical protein